MGANDTFFLRFTSCALKMRHCFQWEDLIRYRVFPPFSFAKLTIYIIACLRQVIAFAPKVIKYKKKVFITGGDMRDQPPLL